VRYEFVELPGESPGLPRAAVPVQLEDLDDPPQLCLVDTGSTASRLGLWVADAVGIDLTGAPTDTVAVGGLTTTARHGRATLTLAGLRYDAPLTFCDPWPFAFGLLGQEGFLRYFRVTICAKEFWLDVEPEDD
jgi:hypothetical protein